MKKLSKLFANLTFALSAAVAVVFYVSLRNPRMGFLRGTPAVVLMSAFCLCSAVTAVMLLQRLRNAEAEEEERDT